MTANQINYAKLKEETRHNLASEALSRVGNEIAFAKAYSDQMNARTNQQNAETNLLNASLRREELLESHRANVARESETQRANQMSEYLTSMSNYERQRSNMANESLTYQQNAERARSNYAQETLSRMQVDESVRHNERTEQQSSVQVRAGIVQTLINTAGNLIGRFAH
jgi:chemotaxis protein histidine kinase CheA